MVLTFEKAVTWARKLARMKHKTEARKGLAIVQINGEADTGSEIRSNGKLAGTLFTRSDDKAIAFLRFDRAKGVTMTAGYASITWDGKKP